jgi:cytochrome bd-type quinol oxidase subunit 1
LPFFTRRGSFTDRARSSEWLYLRTGDELYRTVAKRWTKVMAALFAAGVVTGTILSFEMGLLWPSFTASFGSVFGLGFAIKGFSFFMERLRQAGATHGNGFGLF